MVIERPFLFLRHGRTLWNAEGRIQGSLETALSPEGRAGVSTAAQRLAREPLARIISSPLARARETAERVAAAHRMTIEIDDDLRECSFGKAEGGMRGPWLKDYWKGRDTPDGGEPFEAFADRAVSALRRAVDRDNVLVVAHGGVWRALRAYVRIEPDF